MQVLQAGRHKLILLELDPATVSVLGDEHDTEAMPVPVPGTGSLMPGADLHVPPSNRRADESRASTATQKPTAGHDTESGSLADEDTRAGRLHAAPSYTAA